MNIDQRTLWNEKHAAGEHNEFRQEAGSPFAIDFETYLKPNSLILDLGAGVGGDALYFADHGHQVVATDFSDEVIEQNKSHIDHTDIQFIHTDMSEGIPSCSEVYDAVFAHLSVHYFDDATTRNVFADIARVLKPEGLFAFACKTNKDPEFGQGIEIEPSFFISKVGHKRHFFTPEYANDLLGSEFDVLSSEEVEKTHGSKTAAFLRVITRKRFNDHEG